MRVIFLSFFCFIVVSKLSAQEKWNLKQCVDYALANNISVKQSDVQAKISSLQYNQNKASQYPSLSFNAEPSFNSGRNQDPTTYSLTTQNYIAANVQLQSSVDIFNWFSKRKTIEASKLEFESDVANVEKLKNDLALNVASAYLQVLLSKEQEKITLVQLQQSQEQLNTTRKQVNAGALPELNAIELEAQLANDSANYISAKGNVTQSILSLKNYMGFDAATSFEVDTPPVELIPIEQIANLQPDDVYNAALVNLPLQRVNAFKLKAAKKNADAAKANLYPTISAIANLSSNYYNKATDIIASSSILNTPIGIVNVSGTDYTVYSSIPTTSYQFKKSNFLNQLNENFRQSFGLNISVPIFNGSSLKTNWERNKLNIKTAELQVEADNQKLKQDIYQAYNSAIVALEKFNAAKKNVDAAQLGYDFSQKRYNVGMLTTIELITNQNNLLKAKLEFVQNQFDYVFKMKMLEFYKGQGLKL